MLAIRGLFAFLFLVSLAFGATTISGNQSSYNPGDTVSLTISNDNITANLTWVNVSFILGNYNFSCDRVRYPSSSPLDIGASCVIPSNLANGTWNITAYNDYSSIDNSTNTTFALNSTNVNFNISAATFLPGGVLTYYINTTYLTGNWFNINTSNLSITGNGVSILNCTNITNSSAGRYTRTCSVNSTAALGSYALNLTYPNFNTSTNVSATFVVNMSWNSPTVTLNVSSFMMEKGNVSSVMINITSNSNINETLYINVTGCDGVNLTCSLNTSTNLTTITAFGNTSAILNVTSASGANVSSYTLYINVSNSTNFTTSVRPSLTVIVNPFHNFSLWTSAQPGQIPAGQTKQYVFNITNTGVSANNFSFTCLPNSPNFTCSFNTTNNSVSVDASAFTNVNLSVTALNSSPLGEESLTTVNVTDYYGLVRTKEGVNFNTTTLANQGGVVVTNVSQYVHYAGEIYYFNISVNNTGNIDNGDTLFNITITAQNTAGWTINVSNDSSFANSFLVNSTNSVNLNLSVGNLSSKNISIKINVPAGATYQNTISLFIKAVSAINASRASENSTIIVKLPSFNFLVNMAYNRTAENLSWYIVNISREPGVNLTSFSVLNYSIVHANGTVLAFNNATNVSFVYSNSTLINTTWSGANYSLDINGVTSDSYNFSFRGLFYISRWVGLTMSVPATSNVVTAVPFNATVTNTFEGTGVSVNLTSADRPVYVNFYGTSGSGAAPTGGSCYYLTMTATTYVFTCTPSTLTNTTSYYLNATSTMTSCSRDFSCTFMPSLTNMTYTLITEVTSLPVTVVSNQTNQQTGAGTNTTTNQTTVISTAGLRFTIPSGTINLQNNSYNFSIVLNNTNSSRQNLNVTVSETGAYLHFRIAYIAPRNISGNSVSSLNITLTPFKWSKPGTYTVSVRINSATMTLTVAVPQPNDTKIVHRYIEVSNDRTLSNVTLVVKNRNAYSVIMNITENLPKQIAQSISNVTILSDLNYTIVESDPVIMWNMNMSPNQERTISYSLKGDLGDSNLFNAPTPMEARITAPSSGGVTTAGGGDWTTIIIVIVVLLAVAGGAVFYFFFMRKRGEKMPFNYAVFLGEVKREKGVLSAIKNLPHALMSAVKGKAKEEPKPTGLGAGKKIMGVFGRLKRKKTEEKPKEEPKKEDKKEARAKPSKEELLNKLKEVYKK